MSAVKNDFMYIFGREINKVCFFRGRRILKCLRKYTLKFKFDLLNNVTMSDLKLVQSNTSIPLHNSCVNINRKIL